MAEQQTLWPKGCITHDRVRSVMKDGTVLVICKRCGKRL